MARLKSSRTPVLLALVLWGVLATPAYSACTLPDGPDNTLVPEGYRFAASGRWEICEKGAWTTGETVSDARAFTANNTGVCLPLENQFTKKNGVISMNFVPEKSRRNFYGFEHECVASTWWRVPGGVTVSNPNPAIPDDPAPPAKPKTDPLADLNRLYDDVVQPAQPVAEEPPVATTELPSFSASDRATPAPSPAVPRSGSAEYHRSMPNQYASRDSRTGLEVQVTGEFPEDPDDRVRIARTTNLFTRLMSTILATENETERRERFKAIETQLEVADALIRGDLDEVQGLMRQTLHAMGITDEQLEEVERQLRDQFEALRDMAPGDLPPGFPWGLGSPKPDDDEPEDDRPLDDRGL